MASPPPMTPQQEAEFHQDRRPSLYAGLIALAVINNAAAGGRLLAHWRAHYRHSFSFSKIFAEDYFLVVAALCVNAVIGSLLAATHYGLGLHSWRVLAEDPEWPRNLSDTFKFVWTTMLLTGPTFASIKLTLLFFYRRIFLINQTWLRIAWWANTIYVILWFIGSTGFYLFQCWPVQWYFMQYYARYNRQPPYPITGECGATTTTHVAIPLIFGLFSDVMILVLPLATISTLHMSKKTKIGLILVFSVGTIACLLDMVRIIELTVDTDDKIDPSYGVTIFLILSAATETTAMLCAAMPIIGPQAFKEFRLRVRPSYHDSSKRSQPGSRGRLSKGFEQLGSSRAESDRKDDQIPLSQLDTRTEDNDMHGKDPGDRVIWVESEVRVTVDEEQRVGHSTRTTRER